MIKRFRAVAGAAAALILLLMVVPSPALAQTPTAGPCAAGQKEQVTTQTFVAGQTFFEPFFGFAVVVTSTITRTTYTNYKNVTGLIYITTVRSDGVMTEAYSFPAYLQQAYGGNLAAIVQDLKAGFLHDRGAC